MIKVRKNSKPYMSTNGVPNPYLACPNPKRSRFNNRGFSLVEILISIAILVIVMVPLMNNFFRSRQMNKKAEEVQIKSNLATSIMEGLKSYDMQDTLQQFAGSIGNFNILEYSVGEEAVTIDDVIRVNNPVGNSLAEYDGDEEQATYYFAINGIKIGSTAYDAFITMDAVPYRVNEGASSDLNIMNDYPMPDIINLDDKVNGLLFSEQSSPDSGSLDDYILDALLQRGKAYAKADLMASAEYQTYLRGLEDYESALILWEMKYPDPLTPKPVDDPKPTKPIEPLIDDAAHYDIYDEYFDVNIIRNNITKTMQININNKKITYELSYYCKWTADNIDKTIIYNVSDKQYGRTIENVYLFYSPSIYQKTRGVSLSMPDADIIKIINENKAKPINFFIARQNEDAFVRNIIISRENPSDNITVYTDLSPTSTLYKDNPIPVQDVNSGIIRSERRDRIYNVTVDIYEYIDSDDLNNKYKNNIYTLEGTREN